MLIGDRDPVWITGQVLLQLYRIYFINLRIFPIDNKALTDKRPSFGVQAGGGVSWEIDINSKSTRT